MRKAIGILGAQLPLTLHLPPSSRRPSSSPWPHCSPASCRQVPGPRLWSNSDTGLSTSHGDRCHKMGPKQALLMSQGPWPSPALPSLGACSDGLHATCPGQDVGHKEQPRCPLNALNGHQEALQRGGLVHRCVGHHIGAELNLPACRLQDEYLEEVCGHRHVVLADDLVLHVGLPIGLRPMGISCVSGLLGLPPPGSLPSLNLWLLISQLPSLALEPVFCLTLGDGTAGWADTCPYSGPCHLAPGLVEGEGTVNMAKTNELNIPSVRGHLLGSKAVLQQVGGNRHWVDAGIAPALEHCLRTQGHMGGHSQVSPL